MADLHHPFQFDGRGQTRTSGEAAWIRGLVEQVLFTAPGERVMRPDFGSGLRQLVFAPNRPELAAATQFNVQAALQQWLGNLITPESVEVEAEDSTLRVTVSYVIRRTGSQQVETFTQGGAA
jgi:phage baseplate assembly protein W